MPFRNVGKVITTKNSGRPPVQREFSRLWVLLRPQPRLDRRNPVVDCRLGTWSKARCAPSKMNSLISHHFHRLFVGQSRGESEFRQRKARNHWEVRKWEVRLAIAQSQWQVKVATERGKGKGQKTSIESYQKLKCTDSVLYIYFSRGWSVSQLELMAYHALLQSTGTEFYCKAKQPQRLLATLKFPL